MRTRLVAATLATILAAGPALAERLVIAGRDGNYATALELMVERYAEANPEVEIELLALPYAGLYEKLVIDAREGTAAYDVAMLDDTWAPEFMAEGWLTDLDRLGGGLDDDFLAGPVAVSKWPVGTGTTFAAPFVGNVALFAYRRDLFETHGLPTPPASWTEVLGAASRIDDAEREVAGVVFRGVKGNPIVTGFLPILWAHGGAVVDAAGKAAFDSAATRAAVELWLALKPHAPQGVVTYNSSEVRDALQQGTAAMTIELWPSWAPSLDDPEVSTVPGLIEIMAAPGEVEGPSPMLGTWLLGVPAAAENAEHGRDFIDFVTAAENQKRLALDVGIPPTRASVYADADVIAQYRWYPAQAEALAQARPRPRIPEWSRVETILGDYLQLALIGELPAEDAITEAHVQIERALTR